MKSELSEVLLEIADRLDAHPAPWDTCIYLESGAWQPVVQEALAQFLRWAGWPLTTMSALWAWYDQGEPRDRKADDYEQRYREWGAARARECARLLRECATSP